MSAGKKTTRYSQRNRVKLVRGGAPYFSLLHRLINNAQRLIQIQVYIFADDITGTAVANALMEAASRGVQVLVMVDGYASQGLNKNLVNKMRSAGIHLRFFEPLLRSKRFYFGRRMHQKIVVADGEKALVGGLNIADRYNDLDSPCWLDYAVFIEGEAAAEVNRFCLSFWNAELSEKLHLSEPGSKIPTVPVQEICSVRIRKNDWVRGHNEVWRSYFNLFSHAQESITIMCSYFLPGHVLRRQLAKAAARGVEVKLILAGPSDVMLAKHAERYLYPLLLKNNIRIFEYQPSVLHAKLAVADRHWMTIGSFNVNNISAYASVELNADIRNKQFVGNVQQELERIIENDCIEVTRRNFATNATIFRRFVQRSSYEFIRLVLNLSTFYFRHE